MDFEIDNGTLTRYTGTDTTVIIPNGVKSIGSRAFLGCMHITDVTIPKGCEHIGEEAFAKCYNLENITLSEYIDDIETCAFVQMSGVNFKINYDDMECITPRGFGWSDIKYQEDMKDIQPHKSLNGVNMLYAIIDDKMSLKLCLHYRYIDDKDFKNFFYTKSSFDIKRYDHQIDTYPVPIRLQAMIARLEHPYELSPESKEKFSVYVQKNIITTVKNALSQDDVETLRFLITSHFVTPDNASKIIPMIKSAVLPKAIRFASEIDELINEVPQATTEAKLINITEVNKSHEQLSLEAECRQKYDAKITDRLFKFLGITDASLSSVKYANSEAHASPVVVKSILSHYIIQLDTLPKEISTYKSAYIKTAIVDSADKVAAALDMDSFRSTLDRIVDIDLVFTVPQKLLPFCRYASANQVKHLISKLDEWSSWDEYAAKGRKCIIVARGALLLNDTRDAMLFADKNELLHTYATMRNVDEDILRDTKLSDFGLNSDGIKRYDIGGRIIEAALNSDMTFTLFDTEAKRYLKTFPRKSEDDTKAETCAVDFTEMRKNLRAVEKNQINTLRSDFVTGRARDATGWLISYTQNPVLNRIASLLVWVQRDLSKTQLFTMSPKGPVTNEGLLVSFEGNAKISLAHPTDMRKDEIKKWQTYFAQNRLKQPFEQVWEPIINFQPLEKRYSGASVPMFTLLDLTKKGFGISGKDGDFEICFMSTAYPRFTVKFWPADSYGRFYNWNAINPKDMVTLGLCKSDLRPRALNHALFMMDMIMVHHRVIIDDTSVMALLESFTAAQVVKYLKIAIENKSANCTAALLEYKNAHFPEYPDMDDFTLE